LRCLWASLLFGGASALGPALQSVGITSGYYLLNAAPYVLTLGIIIATSSRDHALAGQPAELRMAR
jgi:simple sugar transport system permease protein